ncbi:hypothetical protein [Mesoterricola sediminis]|uniref:Uncharacterized protein n=1 Tax=Mesoterricola sediminis TaxID=2927980 RepID=A0AA48KE01_9BACT|nr:hypothetical protein [Mesoterricola sediminis]BDU76852.1 hypothetical protein METESE_18100 [Mesoterricola sediminis]
MWNKLLDLWAYWDWFIYRQAPPRANRRTFLFNYQKGSVEGIFPTLGLCGASGMVINLYGARLPETARTLLIFVPIGLMVVLALLGQRRGREKRAEFEHFDKRLVRTYDRYVWIFALSCLALFVAFIVLVTQHPFPHARGRGDGPRAANPASPTRRI